MSGSVLVIQHDAVEGPGLIARALQGAGLSCRIIRVYRGEPVPAAPDDAVGLVVMGGPMGVYQADRYPHLDHEVRLIQVTLEHDRPVLGICLGSQLLAKALGASVYPGPRAEIGWYDISLTPAAARDPLWCGVASPFPALVWHADVFDLPPGTTALASSALTPLQAYTRGENAYGLLFHLEVDAGQTQDMSRAFAAELTEEKIDPAGLVRDAHRCLPLTGQVASTVFSRWAAGVAGRQRPATPGSRR